MNAVIQVIEIFVYGFFSQKKEHAYALQIMAEAEEQLKHKLPESIKIKAARGYSVSKPIYLDAFTLLYGRRLNAVERKRLVYYFTAAALYDSFFDEMALSEEAIWQISFDTDNYKPLTENEKAWIFFHRYLQNIVEDKKGYLECCKHIYEAQKKSLEQFQSTLSNLALEQLTHDKGGYSVFVCHYYLQQSFSSKELECWYLIGSCIQLCNDLYDVYKDEQEGIHTLATRARKYQDADIFFNGQVNKLKKIIPSLQHTAYRKQRFSFLMASVYAFGYIALDNLKRIQGKEQLLPAFSSLQRKQLIIDMELWKNRWKCIRYIYLSGKLK